MSNNFHGGYSYSAPKKAKNAFNQPALDKLAEMSQEPRYVNSAHYPRVFRQGMSSLAKATTEIRTVDEALALHKVGPFLAKIIAGTARKDGGDGAGGDQGMDGNGGGGNGSPTAGGSGKKKKKKKSTAGRKRKTAPPPEPVRQLRIVPASIAGAMATKISSGSGAAAAAASSSQPARKRGRPKKALSQIGTAAAIPSDPAKPSAKQTAYARAVREGEGLSATLDQYGDWRVILLVDRRERKADHVQAKLLMSGIDAEIRTLPIGDMLWIARGTRKRITPGSGLGLGGAVEKQQVEVVLGTVVERKTLEDLASSLFGTRFEEQRLRLKNSAAGASQVIYLVEAERVADLANCSGATLRYAMIQTQVHLGFGVVQTKNLDDTVRYLKRVHRRLMRRSFPSEFRSVDFESGTGRAVPTFTSPDGRVQRTEEARGLVFQNPPVPYEARRHTIYEEFKAKLELARETGTKSVKALHCAMLKQCDSFAIAKVHALTALYETPASLARGYRDTLIRGGLEAADEMVRDISLGRRKIGPKSSTALANLYMAGIDESEYYGEENVALKGGEEELPLDSNPFQPSSGVAASAASIETGLPASTLASGLDVVSVRARTSATAARPPPPVTTTMATAAAGKCTYGDVTGLSSDDDDYGSYERTPRRHNVGKQTTSLSHGSRSIGTNEDDLNQKPAARPTSTPKGQRESDISPCDFLFSSTPKNPGGNDTNRATNNQSSSACFDLTMDSSDEDADLEKDEGDNCERRKPAAFTTDSSSGNNQDHHPRLSHDGAQSDAESEKARSNDDDEGEGEESGVSDSESSCDELVVRLRKKSVENGGKARLPEKSVGETGKAVGNKENGRMPQQHFFPSDGQHSDSSPEPPRRGEISNTNLPNAGAPESSSDVEIIEIE